MNQELQALADEIAATEGLDPASAVAAAQARLAGLAAYEADWDAERRAVWHALRAWAKDWDTMALAARIHSILKQGDHDHE